MQRALAIVAALFIVAWGSAGLYDGLTSGFSGGLYDPEYRVPGVPRGGLAERSGFAAGDRVISVEGRPVEELGMESRWPRSLVPRIGESRRFVVDRNGERIALDVVFPAPFDRAVQNRINAALIGLGFLFAGLWALLTVPTRHARALATIGLAAGASVALGLGPHLGSWNGVQGHLSTALNVLMVILVLRFFVEFPTRKRVASSRLAAGLVYGAWVALLGFLVVELLVHPALYYDTGGVTGLLTLAYSVLVLAAIAHTAVSGPRAELWASGMGWVLAGFGAALLGLASAFVVNMPGWAYVVLTLLVPFSMALAVRQVLATAPSQRSEAP